MVSAPGQRPLIAHVVFRFDYGGLENGVVNVVNGLPERLFRHTIIALTETSDFRRRIRRDDVEVHALNKQPGKDPAAYLRLFQLIRRLRPAILHTRNVGTLEGALVGRVAGTACRIHGEHGWDTHDPDGTNRKYRLLRRAMNPAISAFVTVSEELQRWLVERIGIAPAKITRICNGVDVERFRMRSDEARGLLPPERFPAGTTIVGSVTRFSEIKDPLNLVRAFIEARREAAGKSLRLLMVGDGPLRAPAEQELAQAGLSDAAWLPGSRDDVPALMRAMDVFVLGSRREGISNTVLEAMASGLPVIASAVGGNLELVRHGQTGVLVPPGEPAAIAAALIDYVAQPALRVQHGSRARARVEHEYSLRRMLADYERLYRMHTQMREAA
jgi:sugar transferase (PEP-CTERM/EpsH1 system associated)